MRKELFNRNFLFVIYFECQLLQYIIINILFILLIFI